LKGDGTLEISFAITSMSFICRRATPISLRDFAAITPHHRQAAVSASPAKNAASRLIAIYLPTRAIRQFCDGIPAQTLR